MVWLYYIIYAAPTNTATDSDCQTLTDQIPILN